MINVISQGRLAMTVTTLAVALCLAPLALGATVDTTLFNANDNDPGDAIGGVDEAAGLSTNITASSAVGADNPKDAFGNNDTDVEGPTFIFANGRTADTTPDLLLGNNGESVDSLTWETTSVVVIDGYRFTPGTDGDGTTRGTETIQFSVEGEADDVFLNNADLSRNNVESRLSVS